MKQQREDPEKLNCLVMNFREHKDRMQVGENVLKWSLMQFKEEICAASEIEMRDTGELMGEPRWMQRAVCDGNQNPMLTFATQHM